MGVVVVASGHMVDAPDRPEPRFPPEAQSVVAARIDALFAGWDLGAGDLLLCGGARGADILFAEAALRRGATVRLVLAAPPEEFAVDSVTLPGSDWDARFRELLARAETETLPPLAGEPEDGRYMRVNAQIVDEAFHSSAPEQPLGALVWDRAEGDGRGGAADMVARLLRKGVQPVVIDPTP